MAGNSHCAAGDPAPGVERAALRLAAGAQVNPLFPCDVLIENTDDGVLSFGAVKSHHGRQRFPVRRAGDGIQEADLGQQRLLMLLEPIRVLLRQSMENHTAHSSAEDVIPGGKTIGVAAAEVGDYHRQKIVQLIANDRSRSNVPYRRLPDSGRHGAAPHMPQAAAAVGTHIADILHRLDQQFAVRLLAGEQAFEYLPPRHTAGASKGSALDHALLQGCKGALLVAYSRVSRRIYEGECSQLHTARGFQACISCLPQ